MTRGQADPGRSLEPPEKWDVQRCSTVLDALANPRRLELLSHLDEPMYLREIASELGVSRQATHHHLDRLVEAGLLERQTGRRDSGRVTEYVVVPSRLSSVHELAERLASPVSTVLEGADDRFRGAEVPDIGDPPEGRALWVVGGLDRGKALRIPGNGGGPWFVGRSETADLSLEGDPFVSPEHAEVWREGPDLLVRDLASEHGTYVNGDELGRREEAILDHGDVLAVGRSLVEFWDR